MTLPAGLQRILAEFVAQERAEERAPLDAALVERQSECAQLAADNERLGAVIEDLRQQAQEISLAKATAEGMAAQLTAELTRARAELNGERAARLTAETVLATRAAQRNELENRLAEVTGLVERERAEASGARARAERLAEQLVEGLKRLPANPRPRTR